MFDKDMQKLYVFTKFLSKVLPKDGGEKVNLNDVLLLEYYKLQKTAEGKITLENSEGLIPPVKDGGAAGSNKEKDTLSGIIDKFNKKFGTSFTEQDKVLAQLKADMIKDKKIVNSAKSGDKTAYNTLSDKGFDQALMQRYEENDSFFKDILSDKEKLKYIKRMFLENLYNELRNLDK